MHPTIQHDLVQARTDDLHRQAGRDTLRRAARRARHAPAETSTPFTPAHTIAELTRRGQTLLRSRRPSPLPLPRPGKSRVRPRPDHPLP